VVTDAKYALLEAENLRLRIGHANLEAQIQVLQRMLIRRRSERFIPASDDQLNLFAEVDEQIKVDPSIDDATPHKAVTKRPGRNPLPAHFPLEVEMITPDALDTSVPFSEAQLEREGHILLGFETSERVELRPAQYVRILQKRPRYKNIATGEITVAHARDRVLARSIADETLATDILLKKFLDHQPLYRQAEALKRDYDWNLSRATMGKWVERVAVTLRPLYNKLVERIIANDYVQMDESRIAVLSADKPGATHTGQMWLMRDPITGAVAFRYDKTRSAKVPQAVLAGFNGTLQTDGHSSYVKALKILRAGGQTIEFTSWIKRYEHIPVPKTPLGKAVSYAIKQWPSMCAVLEDGRIELDNNGIENKVRPLALGRKNYLFAGNHGAAQNIAVLYSLLLSCKAAGVNPRDWLNDTLNRVLQHSVNQIHELLPSNYIEAKQDVIR